MSTTRVRRGADVTLYTKSPKIISRLERYVFCSWDDQFTMTDNPMVIENVVETKEYNPIFDHQFLCTFNGPHGQIWDRVNSRFIEEPLWLSDGQEVMVVAIPDANYSFIEWSDGDTNPEKSFIITEPLNVTAVFEEVKEINVTFPEDSFDVTYEKKVTKGQPLTITITEKEGNLRYYEHLVDSEGVEYSGTTIEIPSVEKNMNFDLISLDPVAVSFTCDSGIKFSTTPPTQVKAHSNLSVTIADDTKWFDYWSDQTSYTTKQEKTRTWTDITAPLTISAKACDKYVIYFTSASAFSVGMSNHTASCTKRRAKCEGYRSYETYAGETISAAANGKVYVYRELNGDQNTSQYDRFSFTGSAIKLVGSAWVQNLIGTSKTAIPAFAFYRLFYQASNITSIPDSSYNLTLGASAFRDMMYECTGITTCPKLTPTGSQAAPAYVFYRTWNGTNITGKGNNDFTKLSSYASGGYQFYGAFRNCQKLTANPSGWFTWNSSHMAQYAYAYCFYGDAAITRVGYNYFVEGGSQIGYNYTSSSSAGFNYVFYNMFCACTGLKSAYIWGGYFGSYSHAYMFYGCSNLTLLYIINGNNTYNTSGSHWNNLATNIDTTRSPIIVMGKYGNSTSYNYTWQSLYDNSVINSSWVSIVHPVQIKNTSNAWCEVYDWYNWDSYGKSRHNNMAMKYTDRPIVSFGRTAYSSSEGYQDFVTQNWKNENVRHYVDVLPQHNTGWIGRWRCGDGAGSGSFASAWGGFSTWVWQSNYCVPYSSSNTNKIIFTENRDGGGHWSSWGAAFQYRNA